MRNFWPNLLLLIGSLVIQSGLIAIYLLQENTVHFWDYAMYANMAMSLFQAKDLMWPMFAASFSHNYNLLFALPSCLSFWLFEPSRFLFILTNAVVFIGLNQLAFALILKRIYDLKLIKSLFFACLGTWLIPPFWVPLLQGYPDHAASACFAFAVFFLINRKKGWKTNALSGVFLAFAIIFRRHVTYPALAFIASAILLDFISLWRTHFKTNQIKSFVLQFAFIGGSALLVLLIIEPHYLKSMLTNDFTSLYSSYRRTPSEFFLFCLSKTGLILFGTTLFGYLQLRYQTNRIHSGMQFIGLGFVLWLVLWGFGPTHHGDHYLTATLPLFILVGLVAAYKKIMCKEVRWIAPLILLGLSLFVFWPNRNFPLPNIDPKISLVAQIRPPWQRDDMQALKKLALYIKDNTSPDDRILIAGSSFVFNQDLMRTIYVDHLKDPATAMRFIPAPEIDNQQGPPFNVFASANIYIVPDKAQYHLSPKGQRVVTSLWEIFKNKEGFIKDPISFSLINNVKISVWRRDGQWDAKHLHNKLKAMRKSFGDKTNNKSAWIIKKGAPLAQFIPELNGYNGMLSAYTPQISFLYDKPLNTGLYLLRFELIHDPTCADPLIHFDLESPDGLTLFSKNDYVPQNPGIYYLRLNIKHDQSFISLSLIQQDGRRCNFSLSRLVLSKKNL